MRMKAAAAYLAAVLAAVLAPVAAGADPVDEASAREALFDLSGRTVQIVGYPQLTEQDREVLRLAASELDYYAAIAMAPDEGVLADATVVTANFHGVSAADAAAVRACNGRREGGADCVVVARTLPSGHSPQMLELSREATEAFREAYAGQQGPKAMAISPATGKYAVAAGRADAAVAALADCNAQAAELGERDCELAVRD